MNQRNRRLSQGFSLIELMVTVSIIALLSSAALTALSTTRKKARETKRVADIAQVQKALEQYYTSNSAYPTTGGAWFGTSANGGGKSTSGANAYIPDITPTYLVRLPTDPSGATTGWSGYSYKSDGTRYKLILSDVGPESFPAAGELYHDPVRPTWAWAICSDNTSCNTW